MDKIQEFLPIVSVNDLASLRSKLREQVIVLGTGCFDLLHTGHLQFLMEAREQGDVLIIGMNTDRAVSIIKGPSRPIIRQDQRVALLAALRFVDYAFIYDDIVVDEHIASLEPDVLAIGEESVKSYPSELAAARSVGARVYVVKRIKSFSTTSVLEGILSSEQANSY